MQDEEVGGALGAGATAALLQGRGVEKLDAVVDEGMDVQVSGLELVPHRNIQHCSEPFHQPSLHCCFVRTFDILTGSEALESCRPIASRRRWKCCLN